MNPLRSQASTNQAQTETTASASRHGNPTGIDQLSTDGISNPLLVKDAAIVVIKPPSHLPGVPAALLNAAEPVASSSKLCEETPSGAVARGDTAADRSSLIATKTSGLLGSDIPERADMSLSSSRSYLVLANIPGGPKKEMEVILGDHVDWTCVPFVSTKNRMLSKCFHS
jgi:hypothetical protein